MEEWKMILAPCVLILCMVWDILLDITRDYVKVSSWVPHNLFVLSALTIQILGYVDIQIDTFWMVNKKSFDRIKGRMDEAFKFEKSCKGLLKIKANRSLPQNLRLEPVGNSWIERIANLFSDIAEAGIVVDMKDAFAAYRETRDVLKFVDCPDNIVVDPFNIFGTLNFERFRESIVCEGKIRKVENQLKQDFDTRQLGKKREKVEREITLEEREKLYNIRGIRLDDECSPKNLKELGEMLCTLVGHVIVSGLLEAPDLILKHTRQWAQNFDEGKIEEAVEVAGKVSALLEDLGKDGSHLLEKVGKDRSGHLQNLGEDRDVQLEQVATTDCDITKAAEASKSFPQSIKIVSG